MNVAKDMHLGMQMIGNLDVGYILMTVAIRYGDVSHSQAWMLERDMKLSDQANHVSDV